MAISAKADDSGRYTRKAVRPSFFVPDNEFNKQEHLPAFPTIDNGTIKVSSDGQIMIKNENEPVAYKTTATQQNKLKNKEVHLPSFASKLRKQENKSAGNEEIYDDNDEFNENASEQNSDNIINNTPISVKAPVKKTYTADELYEDMKNYYSVSLLLDKIDTDLLTKMYPEDEKMTSEVKSNAEYYFNTYKQYYNYTQEQFLEKNGFSSYDAFLDYLRLDYRRNKYLEDYVKKNLSEDEIKKYYDENVFGDINTQHILVEVKSDSDKDDSKKLSDADAKKLAEEIITKLNDGTSWEQIQKDYKDKVTYEDLSYQSWDASLEESFMTALKKMDNNSYSEEPVKTSYGYHVIHRLDQKKKPTLKKSRDKIISNLISDKKSADSNLLYKSLISLRKEKNINFSDTDMKAKYESYCKKYK